MTGPTPAVATVRHATRAALADLDPGTTVLVGCSGGADSLALAAALAFEARGAALRAGAVVIDHGLHPDSAEVARSAAAACTGLGLNPVMVRAVTVTVAGQGLEAAARQARLDALTQAANRQDAAAVLLGHTLDDQAEQVLLGLARGSGARSLAGMREVNGRYRRPLLGLRRDLVRRSLTDLGLTWWEDPSNSDQRYLRNRVRAALLPVLVDGLGPGVVPALARTADQLREDADTLDELAGELVARVRQTDADGWQVSLLAPHPDAIRRRALRRLLIEAGSSGSALSRGHVLGVDVLITAWRGQGPISVPGLTVTRRSGILVPSVPSPGPVEHQES